MSRHWFSLALCLDILLNWQGVQAQSKLDVQAETVIGHEDARRLVLALLKAEGYDTESRRVALVDVTDAYFPELDNFEVHFKASTHLSFYMVDRRTAELWEKILCEPVRGKEVEGIQKKLRLRYRLRAPDPSKAPCHRVRPDAKPD
jgi:hypothetical protein